MVLSHRFLDNGGFERSECDKTRRRHVFFVRRRNRHFPRGYRLVIGGVPISTWIVRWESPNRTVDRWVELAEVYGVVAHVNFFNVL